MDTMFTCGNIQRHYGLIINVVQVLDQSSQAVAMGSNDHLLPLLLGCLPLYTVYWFDFFRITQSLSTLLLLSKI